jgi:hypothetical protein
VAKGLQYWELGSGSHPQQCRAVYGRNDTHLSVRHRLSVGCNTSLWCAQSLFLLFLLVGKAGCAVPHSPAHGGFELQA